MAKTIKDILSYPDDALHSTKDVAAYLGRKARTIREMIRLGTLTPTVRTRTRVYFSTKEIRRWFEVASQFKSNLGAPKRLEEKKKGPPREKFADARVQDR